MKLLIISHKETWAAADGLATVGGFPAQIRALSELFDETTLIVSIRRTESPPGVRLLEGKNLCLRGLPEPPGHGFLRKVALVGWLPLHFWRFRREIRRADAVHAVVPGDLGTIGVCLGLVWRKPLFVRQCGTWGNRRTVADRFLASLLPRIAGGRNVVMATGESASPPCEQNDEITWVFSTRMTGRMAASLPPARRWSRGETLRLVTAGRLTIEKNAAAVVDALPILLQSMSVTLDIIGDGPCRSALEARVRDLGLDEEVRFHGNVDEDEVLRIMADGHLFVFPTRLAEGFPKVVIEAMMCSLVVVATPVSALRSLVHASVGSLLEGTSPDDVARACLRLCDNPEELAGMAAAARDRASRYTIEAWREVVEKRLTAAWGPLRSERAS